MRRRVRGVRAALRPRIPPGADREAECRAEGMPGPQQRAHVGRLRHALGAEAEISSRTGQFGDWHGGGICQPHARRNRRDPGRAVRGLSLPRPRPARRSQAPDHRQPQPPARDRPLGVRRRPAAHHPVARPVRRRRHRRRHDHAGPAHGARRPARAASPISTASAAAQAIARARAEARGLEIEFRQGSLLDLPDSAPGPFDYIDCCGVLHHLPDPAAGLRALLSVLAPGGGLGLMLYAPHGRTGVYMLQDALRRAGPHRRTRCRAARHRPPGDAALAGNRLAARATATSATISRAATPACSTCCSIPRDRAYDVRSLAALLHDAGLAITCFMEPMRYDPAALLPDPKLRARIAAPRTRSSRPPWPRTSPAT